MGLLEGQAQCLDATGLPLGLFDGAEFSVLAGKIAEGERFFLYTDGLAENSGRYVTSDAFRALLLGSCQHNAVLPLAQAVRNMLGDLTGDQPPKDDVVLMGIDV